MTVHRLVQRSWAGMGPFYKDVVYFIKHSVEDLNFSNHCNACYLANRHLDTNLKLLIFADPCIII
jgi:hypothetical protein